MSDDSKRIAGLDAIRAIAILSVVFSHSFGILMPLDKLPVIGRSVDVITDHLVPFGILGVELFFVLSGFLIGNILVKAFMDSGDFSFAEVRRFWVRRWFRTLPNYWLILTISILLYWLMGLQEPNSEQLLLYFFSQNLVHPPRVFFFNEAWSLSIEEWFYLTFPIVIFFAARIFGSADKKKLLLNAIIGYLLVFVLIRLFNAFHPINDGQDTGIRKIVLFRLDAVIYGVLIAWLNTFAKAWASRLKNILLAISLSGAGILFYLLLRRDIHITDSPVSGIRFASDAFLYCLLPLFFSFCLPNAANVKTIGRRYLSRSITFISKISYSMYLIHYTLIFLPFFYPRHPASPLPAVGLYLLYWIVVIGVSWLIYKFFEQPILKYRDRVAPGK